MRKSRVTLVLITSEACQQILSPISPAGVAALQESLIFCRMAVERRSCVVWQSSRLSLQRQEMVRDGMGRDEARVLLLSLAASDVPPCRSRLSRQCHRPCGHQLERPRRGKARIVQGSAIYGLLCMSFSPP